MPAPSYMHGTSAVPLLGETIGETIGENLRRTAERFPDREALAVPYQRYRATYRDLWEQTGLVARALIARGVKKGDRVGKGKIATYKIPRYWKFVDGFPMTVTGKVQKYKMREMAIAELGLEAASRVKTA